MSKVAPLQGDFSAGEISPRLRGNTQSEYYRRGLAFCENFEVTPQGSLEMRGGTQNISTINDADAVLQTFIRGEVRDLSQIVNRDVIVVIGADEIQLFDREGPILVAGSGANNILIDPLFWQGLTYWDEFTTEVDFAGATPIQGAGVELFCSSAAISTPNRLNVSQTVTIANPNEIHIFNCLIRYGAATVIGSFFAEFLRIKVAVYDTNDLVTPLFEYTNEWTGGDSVPREGDTIALNDDIIPLTGEVIFEMELEAGNAVLLNGIQADFLELQLIDTTTDDTPVNFPTPATWYTAGGANRLRLIHTCQDSATNEMFFTCYGGDMYKLTYIPTAVSPDPQWTFAAFTPLVGVDSGAAWVAPFPSTCTIHEGRLWLAGTPNQASTLWGSHTWDYDDFTYSSTTPLPSEGVEFTLTSNGAIQWLEGLKNLLIGTDRGEVIGRSNGSVITLDDFEFPIEQTWGSTRIQPAEAGNEALFVTIDSNKVRSLYDGGDRVDGYDSLELTFFSENITQQKVVDLTYTRNPDYHLTCLLSNGQLAISTYYRALGVNGWFRMKSASDQFISVEDINDLVGTSNVFLAKRKNLDQTLRISLEIKNAGNPAGYNLDNYTIENSDASGLVTGLDYLDGYECGIVVLGTTDGVRTYTLHPSQQPILGEITLEPWASSKSVLIGIPYKATAVTLPLEGGNRQGTAQVQKRRFNEIFLRLYESAIPKVDGHRPPLRTPETPMNNSQPLMTGDTSTNQVGWNDGVITIEQDLPLPTQISAIFGKAKGNNV